MAKISSPMRMTRLTDPDHLVTHAKLMELDDKISTVLTSLFQKNENGGNPFLFSFCATKAHELTIEKFPEGVETAMTNGFKFYWHPKFLDKLSIDQVKIVMFHEVYHVVLQHCKITEQNIDADLRLANIAYDYVVNAYIESERIKYKRPDPWDETLGLKYSLKDFLNDIKNYPNVKSDGKTRLYVDETLLNKSSAEIYNTILNAIKKNPTYAKQIKDAKDALKNLKGSLVDGHIKSDMTKEQIIEELTKAHEYCKATRGTMPSEIEELLGNLKDPKLSSKDIIRNMMYKKAMVDGDVNNWSRFRRRSSYIYERNSENVLAKKQIVYRPTKCGSTFDWMCMLDTSGSMSDEMLTNAISELKSIANIEGSSGCVVPVDAVPYWDRMSKVDGNLDLKRVKVVGRGGTVFERFFEELPKKVNSYPDLLIVLTDGYCDRVPAKLRPRCDVLWIVFEHVDKFKPSFGRVIQLNNGKIRR